MSGDFADTNVLKKIFNIIPSLSKPVRINGLDKWRDDFAGSALSSANWDTLSIGTGQSIQVSNSELKISAGTVANAQTIIKSKNTFALPGRVFFIFYISQRIVNQNFFLEVIDSNGDNYLRINITGASNTVVTGELSNSGIVGLSGGFTVSSTANYTMIEFDISIEEAKICQKSIDASGTRSLNFVRHRKIPNPSVNYFIQIRAVNASSSPVSNTDLYIDSVSYQSYQNLNAEIDTSRASVSTNNAIPVIIASQLASTSAVSVADGGNLTIVTSTNLAANAIASGAPISAANRNTATIVVRTDQPGTLFFEQSPDTSNSVWLDFGSRSCVAGINSFDFPLSLQNFRVRYTNGANATGTFNIYARTRT